MELFGDTGLQRMNSRFITANGLFTIWCGLIMNFTSYTSIAIANSAMHIQAQTIIRVFIERFECGCSTTQLLLLGKFEYTGGPIFKVVLEC